MKTAKSIRKKNEGAALVSVLIGVLFISILASSLLYMATLNFQMKKMRYTSTDNFYTAEFALEEMLAQIKDKIQVPDTDSTHTTRDELLAIFDPQTDASTGFKVYNEANLRNLIEIDGRKYGQVDPEAGSVPIIDGIAGIKVSNIYREPHVNDSPVRDYGTYTKANFEEDGKSIKIYGLKVTVTTDEAHGSYESSVSLDLEYAFPEHQSSNYSYGVPFGVLSDSPGRITAGNHVFTGPMYMAANGLKENGHEFAMYVGPDAVVSLINRSFFQGDVYVNKGTLMISDNTYINGNLIVEKPGTVYVTGHVYMKGAITGTGATANGVRVTDSGSVSENTPNSVVNWDHIDEKYGGGLAKAVTAKNIHFYIDSTTGTISGYGGNRQDLWVPIDNFKGSDYLGKNPGAKIVNSGTVDGKSVQAIYLQEDTLNTSTESGGIVSLDNSLIIAHRDVKIQRPLTNSTYINISKDPDDFLNFESGMKAYTNIWGSMDQESFEAAKKLFFNSPITQVTGNHFNVKFATSGNSNMITNNNTSGTGLDEFVLNGTTPVERYGTEPTGLYYYRNPSTNELYMPFGNILSSDYGTLVNDFWGACYQGGGASTGTGTGDKSAVPTLLITHWTKQ